MTRGARLCSFFWIQSLVRDDTRRSLLFELDVAMQRLAPRLPDDPSVVPALTGVYHEISSAKWAEL